MAHKRKQIVAAIVERLKDANTLAGVNVFPNRAKKLKDAELPCILVYSRSETAEVSVESPREYKRGLSVSLELVHAAFDQTSIDDTLDDFAEQVETAMFLDETFGGIVSDTILGDTEMVLLDEGERPVGAMKIAFMMPYYQQLPGDQTDSLDAFTKMGTTIKGSNQTTPNITGTDTVPQS